MSSNKALVLLGPMDAQIVESSLPELREDYMLVKTHAVALNPHDWRIIDFMGEVGSRLGCDYSGIVEKIGGKSLDKFQIGDRVCGVCFGGNPLNHSDGAYGEHISVKADLQIKIPSGFSFEEAATLGVGVTTVGIALYQSLELPLPPSSAAASFPVLIYGGSTATGSLAIQFAKLSGCNVLTTCSPKNFEYVKSLGADKVFDYNSPDCAKDINEFTGNNLTYSFDCISERGAPEVCLKAMSNNVNGRYASVGPVLKDLITAINPNVDHVHVLGQRVFGEDIHMRGRVLEASPKDAAFGKMFWELAGRLLDAGKIKPHRYRVNVGAEGLEGVLKGLQLLRERKVSATKLVYTL